MQSKNKSRGEKTLPVLLMAWKMVLMTSSVAGALKQGMAHGLKSSSNASCRGAPWQAAKEQSCRVSAMKPSPSEAAESNNSVPSRVCKNSKHFGFPLAVYFPKLTIAHNRKGNRGVHKLNNHLTFTNILCYKMLNNSKMFQYLYCIPD